jgi:uncharacterized protein (DUF2147 family)
MRVNTAILMSAAMSAGLIGAGTAWAASDPRGVWIDERGRGGVEIKDCGAKLCGHIVWARDEADSKKGCGKQIIGDVAPQGGGVWDNGWIYDPDKGRRYDVELKPLDDNRLRVKGYAGVKFFSRSMIWTRAPADTKRCDAVGAKAADSTGLGKPADTAPVVGADASGKNEASRSADLAAPGPAVAPSVARAPDAKSGTEPPANSPPPKETAAPPKQDAPKVATAEDPDDSRERPDVGARPHGFRFGNGYGMTETGDGNCRLRVPYFSMTFKCWD